MKLVLMSMFVLVPVAPWVFGGVPEPATPTQAEIVASSPGEDRAPAWSPDGRLMAFESDRGGNRDIWVVDLVTSELLQLTSDPGDDAMPAWSPDGSRVVFQSDRQGRPGLWVVPASGGSASLLVEDTSPELTPHWSPDGELIAFTSRRAGNADVWVVSATGGAPQQVTDNAARDVWPRWSPEGDRLVFFSRRDTGGERDELYLMDWSSRETRRLTRNPTYHDFTPTWSPDGAHVLTAISGPDDDRALAIYDLQGNQVHRFAEGLSRVFQPAWSPDGETIAYAARVRDGEAAEIFLADAPHR